MESGNKIQDRGVRNSTQSKTKGKMDRRTALSRDKTLFSEGRVEF
jgi:hypothetical protein